MKNEGKAKACFTEGLANYEIGRYKEAIENYNKTINLTKDDQLKSLGFYSIGLTKAHVHEYQQAIKYFDEAIELSEDHELKISACGHRAMAKYAMESNKEK